MDRSTEAELIWDARLFIYNSFTNRERPPTIAETASEFQISPAQAELLFRNLHERHAIFLDPQSGAVRMANPYSAIPTRYRVMTNGHAYWANCAWDALGIPAMLASDAQVHARCADNDQPMTLNIRSGRLEPQSGVVHFPLPFVRWYDNLIDT